MKKLLRWLGIAVVVLVCALLLGASIVYAVSSRRINRRYNVAAEPVAIPTDSASRARGRHLVEAVAKCPDCHRANLGGGRFIDDPALARVAAPNLTRGRGGAGNRFRDADWVRVIRHGVLPGGRGAIIMPAEAYVHLSDADLGAVIAYVKSVPPVDTTWPPPRFGPVGRTLLALDKLPVFPAASIDHARRNVATPASDTTVAYGRYLANTGGCHSCHNAALSGGANAAGPPDSPPAANLTPTGLAGWTEEMFVRVLREGKKPDGSAVDDNFMPWRSSGKMSDAEIHAVWLYLRSVPPKEMGAQ